MAYKLAIGAGHYKHTAGKRIPKNLDPKETREWVLNNAVVVAVINRLKQYKDVEILRTDDPTGEKDVTLRQRADLANEWGADEYISVHHNAGIKGGTGGGITVFVLPNAYEGTVKLRDSLYNEIIAITGSIGKGNRVTPLATANFDICRWTDMPCVLLELGFMDSVTDVPWILTPEHAEQCAEGIVNALVKRHNLVLAEPENTAHHVLVNIGGHLHTITAELNEIAELLKNF